MSEEVDQMAEVKFFRAVDEGEAAKVGKQL